MNQTIDIPGVGPVEFPDSMSDADIEKASAKLHADATTPEPEGTHGALTLQASSRAVPIAARETMRLATSPNVVAAAEATGKVIGAVASTPTSVTGLGSIPRGMAGGARLGKWFAGVAQKAAAPVAKAIETVAPYAQTAATLSGAQGVLDLAQMAEPGRKDIGFLGIGQSRPDLDVLTAAVKQGANPTQAAAQIAQGDHQRFAALVTAYSKSLQGAR
jgi:hypothetical protein